MYAEKSYVSSVQRILEKKEESGKEKKKKKKKLVNIQADRERDNNEVNDFWFKHLDEGLLTLLKAHVSTSCLVEVAN